MLRVAINGYGRIGRAVLRALFERNLENQIHIEAINDLSERSAMAHLTRFDTTFGRFHGQVDLRDDVMQIRGQSIRLLQERDPTQLPWKQLGVDVVLECSGKFKKRDLIDQHLQAGAQRVFASHPLDGADLTVVYGVNHELLDSSHRVISNASCTTNCLAPLAKVLHESVGIRQGLLNTVHSYTNDQSLLDKAHKDLYRARAAAESIIPSTTGAAKAIGLVLPELAGRLDGLAVRVPTPNVSLVDLTFTAERAPGGVEAINQILREGAQKMPLGAMECNDLPLVSRDFFGHPTSCVADLSHTRVQGDLVKVLAWYDNEWAFSNRMLDVLLHWGDGNAQAS
ncbi:type I glyceraldehyde-3-phosphate dehydrogenase [Pseudomonas sp. Choline-3u-10]|jgi:glyceraldehyde 3-phosphate dehydrogenase|uniref:type I glyceraldehyde-3-phosphate dehydrogenase n=1 Tax=Pseudomonadaceae TaxID=135621 RepID=UPI0006182AF2|nr:MULTISPECIES: type I glyceraldehyde-3-phosphate dehydrogenase [Pseudomonadaceae]MAL37070.1 type I glyceraldehyde-3-phosphate dehydrogenase [Pseudomonas sp.]MBU0947696.1 type I glyceraldehyde-3-phosphate dehydrogenase [Gammaproteobacteria bacterium]KJJ62949.1 glyceraldehyde-3-phosphate dehydrogenase [Pseudomonas sp. 10B238]MBK3797298.1 type I glyceraldehyde-3-phosphate dehydrogenase [Stutzerimonas stutzeri]MBK3876138.1 type I glyceraldehyde-3-phosphate dehydrogenase [Stutzerimonas stutzeri]|tara:strand:+ start:1764 stop:2783 length:1020 start_codon:yes stop_codon:yes gene_type:complete